MSKFKTQPSIAIIKRQFKTKTTFSFGPASRIDIAAIIKGLQSNEVAGGESPLNILKKSNFTFHEWTKCVNYTLKKEKFPESLKKMLILPQFVKR